MKTNLCGRAVVSVSLAEFAQSWEKKKKKNNKEKAIFEIIPRASKIEYKTRVKKEEVTNYFYYSIELALVLCNKNYIQIISL